MNPRPQLPPWSEIRDAIRLSTWRGRAMLVGMLVVLGFLVAVRAVLVALFPIPGVDDERKP